MAFCHLLENLVINMVKRLIDTATKTGIDATKTASKGVVQKPTATGELIENKITDKITSTCKPKEKKKTKSSKNLHSTRKKTTNY